MLSSDKRFRKQNVDFKLLNLALMKNKLLYILTSPLFISLILSLALLLILPPMFPKYKADLIKKLKSNKTQLDEYCDLNNDGYSEKIHLSKSYINRTSIIVYTKGAVIDQWNFKGVFNMENLFYGDFNNDGLKEIFLLTLYKNKILLNCFNPFNGKRYIIDKPIDDFYQKKGETTCNLVFEKLTDLNNDNIKEFVFGLNAGYPIYPRRLYSYNFVTDSLNKSPHSCIYLRDISSIKTNSNKTQLFIVSMVAVGNCDSTDTYSDHFSWLTVFNKNLEFKFDPIKIGYYPSDLYVLPLKIDNKIFLIVLNIYKGDKNHPCSIVLYDLNGKKIKEKKFQYTTEWESARLVSFDKENKKIYLVKKSGTIEEVDENLNTNLVKKVLPTYIPKSLKIDIDCDNNDELIFYHHDLEKITILRNDFSQPVIIDVPGNDVLLYSSVILNGNENPQLFLRFDNYCYYYNYHKNPLYNFKYLFYIFIYLGFLGLVYLLQKAQKYRAEQKFIAEKKIAKLQIKSIKNQTDLHFTLNIINSIGSLFAKQDTEKANYVFGKYSKLLRQTIINSDKIITTLNDELEYVENYLSLEQFRLKDGLNFEINKDEEINGEIKIPKMLIHTFVENSIKHGIKHLQAKGEILISISNTKNLYNVKITDNGIGRKKAKEIHSFGTGKGLEILNQILDLYFTLEKVRITYEFTDLENKENNRTGTEVLINIPI